MEVIQSFTIDHTHLKPGIYVSRVDKGFITFDLRITEPNKEPAVAPAAIHSLEHLMATWFRNSEAKEDVVYVGPMGCLTGMYIIMTGRVPPVDPHADRGARHRAPDLRQLSAARPADVQMGECPLPRPSAERFPQRVHQATDYSRRRQSLRRRLISIIPSRLAGDDCITILAGYSPFSADRGRGWSCAYASTSA